MPGKQSAAKGRNTAATKLPKRRNGPGLAVNNRKKAAKQTKPRGEGKQFEPGQSGNPNGRPRGARSKVSRDVLNQIIERRSDLVEALLTAAAGTEATDGDPSRSPDVRALLAVLDGIAPASKIAGA